MKSAIVIVAGLSGLFLAALCLAVCGGVSLRPPGAGPAGLPQAVYRVSSPSGIPAMLDSISYTDPSGGPVVLNSVVLPWQAVVSGAAGANLSLQAVNAGIVVTTGTFSAPSTTILNDSSKDFTAAFGAYTLAVNDIARNDIVPATAGVNYILTTSLYLSANIGGGTGQAYTLFKKQSLRISIHRVESGGGETLLVDDQDESSPASVGGNCGPIATGLY